MARSRRPIAVLLLAAAVLAVCLGGLVASDLALVVPSGFVLLPDLAEAALSVAPDPPLPRLVPTAPVLPSRAPPVVVHS